MAKTSKHLTKKWEISFAELENTVGKVFKVTRRMPALAVAETKMSVFHQCCTGVKLSTKNHQLACKSQVKRIPPVFDWWFFSIPFEGGSCAAV